MSKKSNPGLSDDAVIQAYDRIHSCTRVAKELGIPWKRVARILRNHDIPRDGLEIYRKTAERYPDAVQEEILKLHNQGLGITELSRRFGGSPSSVYEAILRKGGKILSGITSRKVLAPDTEKKICELYTQGMSQEKIGSLVHFDQTVISRVLRDNGIPARNGAPFGAAHQNWKGGRTKNSSGYWLIHIEKSDVMASMCLKGGYILEHRLNLARKIGRPLLRSETVHHIDGDPSNNHPENLQLRSGRHGRGITMCCADCGSRNIGPMQI